MPEGTLDYRAGSERLQEAAGLDKNALLNRIGMLIVADPVVDAGDWDGYALIARYGEANIARRISGFRYRDDGGVEAATPGSAELGPALDALREATRVEGRQPWGACVLRIRRDTRKLRVEFEYDAPERWDITPQTLDEVTERARPA